jgi:hypothetical protein
MDDPKIKLYPDGKSGDVAAWNWELLLKGKKIAGGKLPGTQEATFVAARAELVKQSGAGPKTGSGSLVVEADFGLNRADL